MEKHKGGYPKVSIVICSLGRDTILKRCLDSIKQGTFKDYEIILCQEKGNLVELKDKGWHKARGEIIVWCDDDIVAGTRWLESIVQEFKNPSICGVTGPTYVPFNYHNNRDILKESWFRIVYNWLFLEGKELLPGRITSCGANTYGANYYTTFSKLPQEVDFLEPCQFALRRKDIEAIGGFDLGYSGVAEWCDVDVCFAVKEATGGKLIYTPSVKVLHLPIKDKTIYPKRFEAKSRYDNYVRFARRWIKSSPRHYLYRLFLWTYYKLKELRWV